MKRFIVIAVLTLSASGAVMPAYSQGADNKDLIGPSLEPSAPYDNQLLRLAEVLGSIHYLRNLCGAGEGNKWRDVMSSLLVSEKPGPKRRERLVARFNRGYRAFDDTYGTCTVSAAAAGERYRKEGSQLAGQITRRYGR